MTHPWPGSGPQADSPQARHTLALRCLEQSFKNLQRLRGTRVIDPSVTGGNGL